MTRRAFTLIELLVVISIIALLSSVVLASLNSAREKGRLAAGKQFEANVYHAAGDYAVGLWSFSECAGTAVSDGSGAGYTGTLVNGPTWSTDTPTGTGCSILFDGVNDYVSTTNKAFTASDFTFSVWVKNGSASQPIDTTILSNQNDSGNHGVVLTNRTAGGNGWNVFYGNGAGSWIGVDLDKFPLTVGKWQQVVFTKLGAVTSIYIDGALFATRTQSTATVSFGPANNMYFGNSSVGVGAGIRYFTGQIDAVRLYDKALTASEVSRLYAAEKSRHQMALQ